MFKNFGASQGGDRMGQQFCDSGVMSWPIFWLCNSSQQNCLLIWLNYNIKLKSILFFSILTYNWQK